MTFRPRMINDLVGGSIKRLVQVLRYVRNEYKGCGSVPAEKMSFLPREKFGTAGGKNSTLYIKDGGWCSRVFRLRGMKQRRLSASTDVFCSEFNINFFLLLESFICLPCCAVNLLNYGGVVS